MRYYVEINGESSLDIQGLMIQSLPSISKPLMRSKQETIDGRDGDIVTKLGYSAYDKTLKIGLWGNYDINEVIAFFNQEGTITFSNEPDKYYRFTILNRDDYVSQLDKFRTCTIALHCQPYKYKLNEEHEELENEYVEETGTSLTFNNTLVAPMNIDLKGNTLQTGTPTPSSPIPINNVSGDNDIVVCGKNLLPYPYVDTTKTTNGITFTDNGDGTITISGTATANASFRLLGDGSNQYYIDGNYLSGGLTAYRRVQAVHYGSGYTVLANSSGSPARINKSTYTTGYIEIVIASGEAITTPITIKPMLTMASDSTYEEYNGTTYNIDLPSGMELCKIGTNQDYIYKENDKWYLHKEIGKVVLDGSESDSDYNTGTTGNFTRFGYVPFMNTSLVKVQSDYVSNYFKYLGTIGGDTTEAGISNTSIANLNRLFIFLPTSTASTISAFKTWLSTHNTTIYYVLATPTNTALEDL